MTKEDAIKKLRRLLGPKFAYRHDPEAPKADARALAWERFKVARDEAKALADARDLRARELLAADDEYQRLLVEAKAAAKERDAAGGVAQRYPITVGTLSIGLLVEARGDNWAEVVRAVEAKKQTT